MRSALPYIGIVLFLMVLSVSISFFLNGDFGKRDNATAQNETIKATDFPQVGDAEEKTETVVEEGSSFPASNPTVEEEEQTIEITAPDEIIAGLLGEIKKQAEVTSSSFKWKKTDGKTAIALGFKTRFQGKGSDVSVAKEYLREQGFFVDINNQTQSDNVRIEGFSRETTVCLISGDYEISNNFTSNAEEGEGESEIRVDCGKLN